MRGWTVVLLLMLGCYGTAATAADYVDPPGRVARLSYVDGAVSIAPAGSEEWGEALLNRPLTSGDRIWVDAGGRAELEVGSATLRLDENTGLSFVNLTDDVLQMGLTSGVMALHVGTPVPDSIVEVITPNTTVTPVQRGDYTIETSESGDQTIVRTQRGEATVAGASQQAYGVAANEQGVFTGEGELTAEITAIDAPTRFEDWAFAREERDLQSVTARYVSPHMVGYRDLDEYGTWYDEPEYGHVWSPSFVVADWAPYRYGRWVWVSPWGWTWIDDAPWGFAPSHYGRWVYLRHRWGWVPGPAYLQPVYAPALVGWAGDPYYGIGNVGWFPLAPREAYVPCYRSSYQHFRNVNVSNTIIINNTYIDNVYHGRGGPIDYRNRRVPHAMTVVQRDAFVSAHRVGDHRARVDDDMRRWPSQGRAPTIMPGRDSIIGVRTAAPSRAPRPDRWEVGRHFPLPTDNNGAAFAPEPTQAPGAADGGTQRPQPSTRPVRAPHQPTARRDDERIATSPDVQPQSGAPAQPAADAHVQRQWSGRHGDGTRTGEQPSSREQQRAPRAPSDTPRYSGTAPAQTRSPHVAERPEQQSYQRHEQPRQPHRVDAPPRASIATPVDTPRVVAPSPRVQAPLPRVEAPMPRVEAPPPRVQAAPQEQQSQRAPNGAAHGHREHSDASTNVPRGQDTSPQGMDRGRGFGVRQD